MHGGIPMKVTDGRDVKVNWLTKRVFAVSIGPGIEDRREGMGLKGQQYSERCELVHTWPVLFWHNRRA